MDKFAVLVTSYPSKQNPAAAGFVHSRVKAYLSYGLEVDVLCLSKETDRYQYEGVNVCRGSIDILKENIERNNYKKILVHFLLLDVEPLLKNQSVIVWVHGFEALSWKRRLFNFNWKFPAYIIRNRRQLNFFRHFALNYKDAKYVFVSEWMRKIAESDCNTSFSRYEIIPNYINEQEFNYIPKPVEQKNKILIIRSFASRKYANDISVSVIQALSKKDYFDDLEILIIGTGKHFSKLTKRIAGFKNVTIQNRSLDHEEISALHKQYGVFLCPTRQDAQGVSMCEAMSSGLVPITSNNTAIPEFVSKKEGFLCDNLRINTFLDAFDALQDNKRFLDMSESAHQAVAQKCSLEETIMRELKIIRE